MQGNILSILDRIHGEWENFVSAGNRDIAGIRSQIVESWIRCSQAGVSPYDTHFHKSLEEVQLADLLQKKDTLIKIAKPFMSNLYKFVKGSGFVVVLTDENGFIMDMLCDDDTLKNPMTRNFFSGSSWHEDEAGTNAIGTALMIQGPIQVSGAEHYCQKHHCLTCSAAPIFDPNGRVIGILDMSGASHASHLHTLGMVVAAAEAIMAQLRIRQKNCELALVNSRLSNFFNTVSDGVLMVDKNEVITELNPAAKFMIGRSEQNIIGMPIGRLLDCRAPGGRLPSAVERYSDVEIMIDTKDGICHCLASGEPVINEMGDVTGSFIVLRPIKQVQNLVNRFSGYYATLQFSDIIGESDEIHEAIRLATLTATTSSSILLQGESGTGKEIFAQAIHNRSNQSSGPFIALNCGAIPRELIGSELFGYEEGAFTGAKRGGKPGKFELASGGTLFLDEIGDMPLEQQISLLRVIQDKKVARIGSDKMIPVNVRLICATNRNLLQEVERGTFRQDLFYRLNVISITIPPLRNRVRDIPMLFVHFLEKMGRDRSCRFDVELDVFDYVTQYSWPGNVRELQNVVERAASLAENGVISLRQLPAEFYSPFLQAHSTPAHQVFENREQRQKLVKDSEKNKIINLLNRHAGNVSRVAREMGFSRKTLYSKMRSYAIQN
ncbi:MAG TPA: sigma-54-dependent Fis family transcriptional regulator [Dissulfurispiraceae bacterium]|nr:sigma-54-dependent Fis family transcriptional regulator [Dissulfurispiraceae bacterium]